MNSTIPMTVVDDYHKTLINNTSLMQAVTNSLFSKDTILKFKLGFDAKRQCLTIPIIEDDQCYNIKLYNRKTKPKYFSYRDAEGNTYGEARLWGLNILKNSQTILICAGEKDRMIAIQHGFAAVCGTTGEECWHSRWNPHFKDKTVIIIYDNDRAGRNGAKKVAEQLAHITTVKVVDLSPICTGEGEDLHNFFVKYGKTPDELKTIINKTEVYKPTSTPTQESFIQTQEWPVPKVEVFHGLAGRIIKKIEPHTEADPMAILVQFLVMFGNIIGRNSYYQIEATTHHSNLFAVITGTSAKARKGTSFNHVKRIFDQIEPDWIENNIHSGLRSGEALIWEVRDDAFSRKGELIPGVKDKRCLFIESELAFILKTLDTQGNIISVVLRQAWDGITLKNTTKHDPSKATNPHISFIGHITNEEVIRYLNSTESANGFANRFLWVCSKRSKLLPHGGQIETEDFSEDIRQLKEVILFAVQNKRVCMSVEADKIWSGGLYEKLSSNTRTGMFGNVASRAEAQVVRLALIYAILDQSQVIDKQHLIAALAVWEYCEASAKYIFGDSVGDPVADKILLGLKDSAEGLTLTEIQRLFSNNKSKGQIDQALKMLARQELIHSKEERTGGRPVQKWFVTA